jgi:hypothetical protein
MTVAASGAHHRDPAPRRVAARLPTGETRLTLEVAVGRPEEAVPTAQGGPTPEPEATLIQYARKPTTAVSV